MIRLMGAAILVIASTAFGLLKSAALCARVQKLSLLERYIRAVGDGIRFSGEEQGRLQNRLFKEPQFAPLGKNFEDLNDSDRLVATEFINGLGKTDTEGQLLYCDGYAERVAQRKTEAEREYLQKGKLYKTLGVLFGLSAALLAL